VLENALDGLVAIESAAEQYGVVLAPGSDGRLAVDAAATAARRQALAAAGGL
jgi:hypothetical protein